MTSSTAGGRRDVLSVLIAQSVQLLCGVVVQVLLAWLLLPAGRGLYAVYAVLATILPVLFAFGSDRAVAYFVMAGRSAPRQALGAMLLVASGAAALSIVAAWLAPASLTALDAGTPWAARCAVLVLLAAAAFHTCLLRLLTATRSFREYLTANLVQGLTNVLAIVVLVPAAGLGLTGAVAAFAGSYIAGALYTGSRLIVKHGPPLALPSAALSEHRAYGLRYYPALLAHAIDFNLGTLLLAAMTNPETVGLFAAVSALMLRFLVVAQSFQEVVLPRVASGNDGRQELVAQLSRLSTAGTGASALVFAAVSYWVLPILLSPAFAVGAGLTWWMVPGLALHASSALLMPYFEGTNRPQLVSLAIWLGLVANALALVFLVPLAGAIGAAIALSAGMAVRFAVLAGAFLRLTSFGLDRILVMHAGDMALLRAALPPLGRNGR